MTQTTIDAIQAEVPRMMVTGGVIAVKDFRYWMNEEGKVLGEFPFRHDTDGPFELGQVVEGKFIPKGRRQA